MTRDLLPEVSVFAEPKTPLAEFNETPGTFIFKLSHPAPPGGLIIQFQAGDTDPNPNSRDVNIGGPGTTNIEDFNIRPIPGFTSTVTITEGATEAKLVITPFRDDEMEIAEIISLTLLPSDDYQVDEANQEAAFTIIDPIPFPDLKEFIFGTLELETWDSNGIEDKFWDWLFPGSGDEITEILNPLYDVLELDIQLQDNFGWE